MIGEFANPDQQPGQKIMAEDIRHLIDAARQTFNISAADPLHVDILPSGMHLWKDEEPEVWLAKTTGTITAFVQTTITRTATLVNGSAVITGLSQTSDLAVGMTVSGTGIVPGSTISSIDSSSQVTLNLNCTASGSQSLTFSSDQMGSGTVDLYKLFNPTASTWFSADTLISQTAYTVSTSTIATGTYVLLFQEPFSKRFIIVAIVSTVASTVIVESGPGGTEFTGGTLQLGTIDNDKVLSQPEAGEVLIPDASATSGGFVNQVGQSFKGLKQFNDGITIPGDTGSFPTCGWTSTPPSALTGWKVATGFTSPGFNSQVTGPNNSLVYLSLQYVFFPQLILGAQPFQQAQPNYCVTDFANNLFIGYTGTAPPAFRGGLAVTTLGQFGPGTPGG